MKKIFALGMLGIFSLAACKVDLKTNESEVKQFQSFQIFGKQLGIGNGTLALTFDDGPGDRTLELAKYLVEQDVPATFFMLGSAAKAHESMVAELANMRLSNGSRAFLIANHTNSHAKVADTRTNVEGEIERTHAIVKKYEPDSWFFRSPYGQLIYSAARKSMNSDAELNKYVGSVFWDIGGELTAKYAADWACWGKKISISECGDKYVSEALARNGGILLAHDVHGKTVDMMKQIIPKLKAKLKIVPLNYDKQKIIALGGKYIQAAVAANNKVLIEQIDNDGTQDTEVALNVDCGAKCRKIEVYVGNSETASQTQAVTDGKIKISVSFEGTGQHQVIIKAYDLAGKFISAGDITVISGVSAEGLPELLTCTVSGGDGFANVRDFPGMKNSSGNDSKVGTLANNLTLNAQLAANSWYKIVNDGTQFPKIGISDFVYMGGLVLDCRSN